IVRSDIALDKQKGCKLANHPDIMLELQREKAATTQLVLLKEQLSNIYSNITITDTFKCISQNMASLHSSYETAHGPSITPWSPAEFGIHSVARSPQNVKTREKEGGGGRREKLNNSNRQMGNMRPALAVQTRGPSRHLWCKTPSRLSRATCIPLQDCVQDCSQCSRQEEA
ncbi:hypothetical protein KUCAC02_023692, partial [Chaenocephalus aceratus]